MSYRSNAAEAWYPEPEPTPVESALDLLPPPNLTQPLWRSLAANLRDTFAPPKLPPLQLESRPVDVGMLLVDRISRPWFRTIFTNIGDVVSPEALPPLELESRPVDVGELITDQLSHFWWGSLLRNLADRVAPEKVRSLDLTAKPVLDVIPKAWLLLPLWSDLISTPKVFYPDKPAPENAARVPAPRPVPVVPDLREVQNADPTAADLIRDLRRSRIRKRIWISLATAQVIYLMVAVFWPSLL
ncbi:MAG: hypothetical protein LAO56_12630 [Acidobacteriia bacterium]|nr:hypothetical protein [Terriglobia bacterium]